MASFADQIREAHCNSLHRVVKSSGEKYLCYTRLSKAWYVIVTDGVALWKADLDEEEVDALRDLSGVSSMEGYLTRFRNGFNSGDISVSMMGNKVTMTVGKGTAVLTFDLYEATAADKKTEMQTVLFRLAEDATSLTQDLEKAKQTIDTLKMTKGGPQTSAFMDLGPKKGGAAAKAKPNKAGMSVLNPSSKKRKAAHGVVFD